VEQAFLSGVNHVFYHGTAYSPAEVTWPGWLFYASTEFTPANSFWPHLRGLNDYIARCQSVLQSGTAYNDLLVYWPVYDVWMNPESADLQLTIHSIDKWLYPTPFCKEVKELMKQGYSVDFTSDRLLYGLSVKNGMMTTKSGSSYRTLIVPACQYMPVSTLKGIIDLAKHGAEVIFQQMPEDVPGMKNLDANRKQCKELVKSLKLTKLAENIQFAKVENGEIIQADDIRTALEMKKIGRETLVDSGLKYIRRKSEQGVYYYLVNHSAKAVDGYLPFNENGKSCLLMDPQSGATGAAKVKEDDGKLNVRLQMDPGEAMIVLVSANSLNGPAWKYREKSLPPVEIKGPWKLGFTTGGAKIPAPVELQKLVSWTDLPDTVAQNFSGSAKYTATFRLSGALSGDYMLDLGKVCESARVSVNGQDAGILWSIPFTTRVGKFLKPGLNTIEIEVANLMANRIRQMDQRKVQWRNYHEINFVNIDYKPFDASGWKLMNSGLIGPVTLTPFN
jgi:hypothetical protein